MNISWPVISMNSCIENGTDTVKKRVVLTQLPASSASFNTVESHCLLYIADIGGCFYIRDLMSHPISSPQYWKPSTFGGDIGFNIMKSCSVGILKENFLRSASVFVISMKHMLADTSK